MKRRSFLLLGAACLAALLSTVPMPWPGRQAEEGARPSRAADQAPAPSTRSLGTVGSWSAYASGDKAGRVCYLVGQPEKSDSAGIARKAPVAMVTHRPAENIANVVSFVEGYPLKKGSEVALEVGDKKFELFTKDDSAWARTAELDRTIVATLANGRSAIVKGTPHNGKPTTDIYSLAGFAKALALIDKACGIGRPEIAGAQAAPAPQKARRRESSPRRNGKRPCARPRKAAQEGVTQEETAPARH